ncbi:hypothetical protein AA15973_2119 [Komagataeibacter sucrofermentans DSM 15973]|nr:hypothetical protein AA15973_2119 [Komagataeibacter sucrofermentans DSM 15973]
MTETGLMLSRALRLVECVPVETLICSTPELFTPPLSVLAALRVVLARLCACAVAVWCARTVLPF